jgi:hypothetical protein
MSDDESGSETELIDRRTVLAAVGTATATGLAGCGGDSGSDDDEEDEDDESDDTGTDGENDQPSGMGPGGGDGPQGGGDGASGGGTCATVPSSYTREDVPTILSDDPLATIGVPASGPSVSTRTSGLRVEYSIGSITVNGQQFPDSSVEEALSTGLEDVTDQYDLPPEARALRNDGTNTDRVEVYLPDGPNVVLVMVSASGPGECLDGPLVTVRDEMVDSVQLA